jgi:SNF2 family DNA or RNA helicase
MSSSTRTSRKEEPENRKRIESRSHSTATILPFIPHRYQRKAIKFLLERGAAGLFLDPGLGKTAITLAAIKLLKKQGLVSKVLIIAPLRVVYSVWPAEIKKWKDFHGLTVSIVHGGPKKREEALRAEADIYLMNPEGLAWLEQQKRWHFDMLVVDESSQFRNSNTARFKIIRRLLRKFRRRYILTGTPAPNGLLNLFGQIYILDQGRALGAYITHYRNRYFYPTGYGGYEWVLQKGADQLIYKKIKPLVLRMEASDYLELPPLITDMIHVELPESAQQVYLTLERDLIARINGKDVVAANAGVASQKCRQVAGGGLYVDDRPPAIAGEAPVPRRARREAIDLHTAKAEAVAALVDELSGQPALVAYEFHHDLARLKKVLGQHTPHIGGGVSAKRGRAIERDWNAGKIPVLLVQPSATAFGLNLQEAGRAVIFHSLIWDLEAYEQLIQRVWRQGQTNRVFLYHIVSDTSVDRAILAALRSKSRTQQALLDALKKEIKPKNI